MERVYYIIGRVVERTQLMEKDLEDVVKFSEVNSEIMRNPTLSRKDFEIAEESAEYLKNKMETMTLGQRIHIICEIRCFERNDADKLKKVLEKRNYFAHEYFKYTPFESLSKEEFDDELEALKTFYNEVNALHKKVLTYKKTEETIYNTNRKKLGY